MGGVVSTVINIGFYTSVLSVGAFAGYLALTKPRSSNLDMILNEAIGPESITNSVIKSTAAKTLNYTVKDYVFFKTVEINLPGGRTERLYGGVNTWYFVLNGKRRN